MAKLSTTRQVEQLLDHGKRLSGQFVTLWYLPHHQPRTVLLVSKKNLSKAVQRNRARRRVAAILSQQLKQHPLPGQIACLIKPSALAAPHDQLESEIKKLMQQYSTASD